MHRECRHCRVETPIGKSKMFRRSVDRDREMRWPLGTHGSRRLDGRHLPIDRLIGASAGTDIQDRFRIAESGADEFGYMGIRLAIVGIARSDHAVIRIACTAVLMSVLHLTPPLLRQTKLRRTRKCHCIVASLFDEYAVHFSRCQKTRYFLGRKTICSNSQCSENAHD